MSTLKVTNIQHGSATNVAMVLDTAGTVKAYSTISVGNVTPSSSGAGITFPATQSASSDANTLDDYEEGTFTPTISGSSSAGTATYNVAQAGTYTKIGNVVYFTVDLGWSSGTGTGNLRISGLPFTSNSSTAVSAISFVNFENIVLVANNVVFGKVPENNTIVVFESYPLSGGATNSVAYDAAGRLGVSGCYRV